eukprot:scaffold104627_cov14-Tisochrysis_lutea.AAC.1
MVRVVHECANGCSASQAFPSSRKQVVYGSQKAACIKGKGPELASYQGSHQSSQFLDGTVQECAFITWGSLKGK